MESIGCPETAVRNYHYSLRNNPEERTVLISFAAETRYNGPCFYQLRSNCPEQAVGYVWQQSSSPWERPLVGVSDRAWFTCFLESLWRAGLVSFLVKVNQRPKSSYSPPSPAQSWRHPLWGVCSTTQAA